MLVIENVEYIKMYDAGEQSIYSLDLFQVGAWGEVSIDVGRGKGNKLTLKGPWASTNWKYICSSAKMRVVLCGVLFRIICWAFPRQLSAKEI